MRLPKEEGMMRKRVSELLVCVDLVEGKAGCAVLELGWVGLNHEA
jgi:hypothetical protein